MVRTDTGYGQAGPLLGQAGKLLHNATLGNAQSAKTAKHSLKHTARACGKIRVVASCALTQNAKRRTFVRNITALPKPEGFFAVSQLTAQNA